MKRLGIVFVVVAAILSILAPDIEGARRFRDRLDKRKEKGKAVIEDIKFEVLSKVKVKRINENSVRLSFELSGKGRAIVDWGKRGKNDDGKIEISQNIDLQIELSGDKAEIVKGKTKGSLQLNTGDRNITRKFKGTIKGNGQVDSENLTLNMEFSGKGKQVKLNHNLDGEFRLQDFGIMSIIAPVAGGVLITGY